MTFIAGIALADVMTGVEAGGESEGGCGEYLRFSLLISAAS